MLSGCAAALPAIGAAASIAGAAHSFLQVSEDVVALTAKACQSLAVAPRDAANAWYDPICNDLRPSRLAADTPLWLAEGLGRKAVPIRAAPSRMLPVGYTWYDER